MKASRIRIVVEISLTVALAAVLGMIKLLPMPQGGSISLVMLPLFVLALVRGPVVGIAAGALYGGIDYMLEPYFFHPLQVLLDYPIAFAACGLAGVFAARWIRLHRERRVLTGLWTAVLPGVALGALGRYAAHVASGVVFFATYAPEGQPVLVYSAVYNVYVLVSALVAAFVIISILPPLQSYLAPETR